MAEDKKYYWLKLKRDFFKRHDIRIIESMQNGKDYILFYIKLLLEGVDHEGSLRFSESIPYTEEMLGIITNTNIDIVRSAMKIFTELNMINILDDNTIYMAEVKKLVGSETKWAEKKRLQRAKEDNVQTVSSKCPTEIEKENRDRERDIERDRVEDVSGALAPDNCIKALGGTLGKGVVFLSDAQDNALLEFMDLATYDRYISRLADYIIANGDVQNHYATILRWYKEDTRV